MKPSNIKITQLPLFGISGINGNPIVDLYKYQHLDNSITMSLTQHFLEYNTINDQTKPNYIR